MKQALGLVEVQGLSTAVMVADTMVKAANVTILEIENSKGQGYMTVKIAGDVGAVNAAVSAGKQTGLENQKLVSFKVIARPADSVDQIFGAAKKIKTDTPIQLSQSAKLKTQTENDDTAVGEESVKKVIKETAKLEEKPEIKSEVKSEVEPGVEPAVKPEVQLEEKLEEKPAQEPQAEPQAEPEKASSVTPSGAKKTGGNKSKN